MKPGVPAAALAVLAAALALPGCRTRPMPPGVDAGMAACVPAGARALAGLDLDRLRATPLYHDLRQFVPAAWDVPGASSVLVAWDGTEPVAILRGRFRAPPPGATAVAAGLALFGPGAAIRAAIAQHGTGQTGATDLLAHAAAAAAGEPVWIVARGGVTLPLSGNAANLNRLLRTVEFIAIVADLTPGIPIEASGVCRDADAARQLEESLRALITLAGAGESRQPRVRAVLDSIQVRRDGRTVRATLSGGQDLIGIWAGPAAR